MLATHSHIRLFNGFPRFRNKLQSLPGPSATLHLHPTPLSSSSAGPHHLNLLSSTILIKLDPSVWSISLLFPLPQTLPAHVSARMPLAHPLGLSSHDLLTSLPTTFPEVASSSHHVTTLFCFCHCRSHGEISYIFICWHVHCPSLLPEHQVHEGGDLFYPVHY